MPWNLAEIGDILTFAPCFEAAQLVYLLLKLGWLDAPKQGSGKAISLEAHIHFHADKAVGLESA